MVDSDADPAPNSKPLVEIERSDIEGDDEVDEGTKQRQLMEKTFWARMAQGTAIASAVLAVLAMVFSATKGVTVVAGLIAVGVSGLVIYQQEKLQDTDTLRRVQNQLRKEVNRLQIENNKLAAEVDKMEGVVSQLKGSETKLESIARDQGSNVSSLLSLVKENSEIQSEMLGITKTETLQKLFDTILKSDKDGNFKIGELETTELLLRLKVDPRVEIDTEILKVRLESAEGQLSIRDLAEDLMSAGEEKDGEHIFSFNPEKICKSVL